MCKEDQCSPRHSYQAQRTSRLMNKLDCFEYSLNLQTLHIPLSEDKGLLNEYKCVLNLANVCVNHFFQDPKSHSVVIACFFVFLLFLRTKESAVNLISI